MFVKPKSMIIVEEQIDPAVEEIDKKEKGLQYSTISFSAFFTH